MDTVEKCVTLHEDVYEACKGAHAVAVCTEWDEFKALDWRRIYSDMLKPAFVFDGRGILPHRYERNPVQFLNDNFSHLLSLGFRVEAIGKKVSSELKDFHIQSDSILSPSQRVLP
jgi:UDPglucose 6-dehydrogenase